jgi:predicted DNA-binding transcriptional regulator AlpA
MINKALAGQQLPELENFDRLPDAGYVKQRVVQALFACSAATLWRRIRDGQIPSPARLAARSNGWHVGSLRKALTEIGAAGPTRPSTRKQYIPDARRRSRSMLNGGAN